MTAFLKAVAFTIYTDVRGRLLVLTTGPEQFYGLTPHKWYKFKIRVKNMHSFCLGRGQISNWETVIKAWWLAIISNIKYRFSFMISGENSNYWFLPLTDRALGTIFNTRRGNEYHWFEWWKD